jgi:hypothetical protein
VTDETLHATPARPRFAPRLLRMLGWIVVVLLAWLAFRGYRQPELLLEFANFRLC